MSGLRLMLLGPVSANVDGRTVELGPPQRRAVLAVLLLSAGQAVPIASIVNSLWASNPPRTAIAAVQVHVHHLRQVLEHDDLADEHPPRLITHNSHASSSVSYAIHAAPHQVDIVQFRHLVERGDQYHSAQQWDRAVTCLDDALNLWQGEALANLNPAPFVKRTRLSLAELRLTAHKQRASALVHLGAAATAIPHLQELLDSHPNDETVVLLLTTALCRTGASGRALDLLAKELERWDRELGLHPPALIEQRTKILSNVIGRDQPWLHDDGLMP
jgi:DNA-binding SARP family transcriptional activator